MNWSTNLLKITDKSEGTLVTLWVAESIVPVYKKVDRRLFAPDIQYCLFFKPLGGKVKAFFHNS